MSMVRRVDVATPGRGPIRDGGDEDRGGILEADRADFDARGE